MRPMGWRLMISATPSLVRILWSPFTRSVNPSLSNKDNRSAKAMLASLRPLRTAVWVFSCLPKNSTEPEYFIRLIHGLDSFWTEQDLPLQAYANPTAAPSLFPPFEIASTSQLQQVSSTQRSITFQRPQCLVGGDCCPRTLAGGQSLNRPQYERPGREPGLAEEH